MRKRPKLRANPIGQIPTVSDRAVDAVLYGRRGRGGVVSVARQLVEVIDSDACASITVAPSTRLALVEVVVELWEIGPNGGDRVTKRLDLDPADALELARALRQAAKTAQREQEEDE